MTAEALIRNTEILGNFLKNYRQLEALFRAKACRHRLKTRLVTNNATLRKKTFYKKLTSCFQSLQRLFSKSYNWARKAWIKLDFRYWGWRAHTRTWLYLESYWLRSYGWLNLCSYLGPTSFQWISVVINIIILYESHLELVKTQPEFTRHNKLDYSTEKPNKEPFAKIVVKVP